MSYKKNFATQEAQFVDGGSLASDLSANKIAFTDWLIKDGWRRSLESEAIREGWDYWRPNGAGSAANQKYTGVTGEVLAIEEIKNPAGNSVIVAVVGATIRKFSFDTASWTQIGSGFQTANIRRWQIQQLNGVAFFNNGVDLPVYWRIGDATTTPVYQLREKGVASVGYITEFNGVLMAGDITEVNASYMSTLMNSGSPFGLVPTPATNTSRTQYRIIWSNESDGLDWAAVVNFSGTSGMQTITLDWPMPSLVVGTEVTLVGAGPSGGDLVTTVTVNGGGTGITVAAALSTTVSGEPMGASGAFGSIVGYYDIQDDGSPILAMMPLQNRLVIYRTFAIFVGVYTGQTDFPFQFDRTYQGDRSVRFPYTLVNVRGQYHMYAGANFFYTYTLGALEPSLDPAMAKCARSQFFDKVKLPATIDLNAVYAVDNGVTNEIFFVVKTNSAFNTYYVLAYDYVFNTTAAMASGYPAYAGATVRNPLAGNLGDGAELIFIFGDAGGNMVQYGRTSKQLNTMLRFGASWTATLRTGVMGFEDDFNEKDLRSYVPLLSSIDYSGGVAVMDFSITSYTYNNVTDGATLRTTSVINNTVTGRRIVPLWQRAMYHQLQIAATVSYASLQPRMVGHIIEFDVVATRSTTRKS